MIAINICFAYNAIIIFFNRFQEPFGSRKYLMEIGVRGLDISQVSSSQGTIPRIDTSYMAE